MKPTQLSRAVALAIVAGAVSEGTLAQTLEEVVVTARKRSESIQDVPVAVSAIAGEDVEMAFTLDTTSLQAFAPNVVFDTIEMGTPGGGGFSIRGIAYQDVDKAFDPTVLVAVDDVPLATGTGQVFDLIDIDRIEILRGPQGTLFGKNVVGGLINVHRTKPKLGETSGKVRLRAGQYEKIAGGVLFNYGGDEFAVKLTANIEDQGKGYLDNIMGGTTWARENQVYGAHFLWAPNETFTGELILDHSNLEGTPGGVFNLDVNAKDTFCLVTGLLDSFGVPPGGAYCSGQPNEPTTGRDKVALDGDTWNELEKSQATLRLSADITEDHTLTYIGSWLVSDDDQALDGDATPYELYHFRRWGTFDQTTSEIRLSRNTGSKFTWQVGAFGATSDGVIKQDTVLTLLGCDLGGAPCTFSDVESSSKSYSFFGEGDYATLDDRLVFTAGARYINEKKSLAREEYSYPLGIYTLGPNAGGSREDEKVIYRFGARYHFNDDIMAYVTTSTGFRSGGLSPRAATAQVLAKGYEPEELTNYEAGIKASLFDNRLLLNLTAFMMKYEDMQIELAVPSLDENGNQVGTGTQLAIENAGEAELSGLEMDFTLAVTDWWRLFGNVGYLDASYEELFVNIWGDQDATGALLPAQDETHLDMRRAPEFNYGINSVMHFDVAGGDLSWRLAYSYTDDYEGTITNYPVSKIESYGMLDSSLTYSRDNWRVSLFGRNLTDEDPWTHNFVVNPVRPTATDPAPGTLWRFALRRPPREVGAELVYEF